MNPVSLLLWAIQDSTMLVVVGVISLAILTAFFVFGGGWD
jgi:hypothetical protein